MSEELAAGMGWAWQIPVVLPTYFLKQEPSTDGGMVWVAWFSEMDGCRAQGETAEEAVQTLYQLRPKYIAAMEADHSTPEPEDDTVTEELSAALARIAVLEAELARVREQGEERDKRLKEKALMYLGQMLYVGKMYGYPAAALPEGAKP